MAKLTPVDFDPFADAGNPQPQLTPVDFDPFSSADPSFKQRLSADHVQRGQEFDDAAMRSLTNPNILFDAPNLLAPLGRAATDIFVEAQKDVIPYAGKAADALYNSPAFLPQKLGVEALKRMGILDSIENGNDSTKYAIANSYDRFSQNHPDTSQLLNNLAGIAGGASVAALGKDAFTIGRGTLGAADRALGLGEASGRNVIPKAASVKADALHASLNDAYQTEKATSGVYYQTVKQQAEGKIAPGGEKLKANINGLLADLEAQPSRNSALESKFKSLKARLDNGDNVTVDEVLDLRQSLNENFKSNVFPKASGTPYASLKSEVDSVLGKSSEQYPAFGEALNLADDHFRNNVVPFRDPVIKQFFKPQDVNAYRQLEAGRINSLPAETQKRAEAFVRNVKDKATLDNMRALLPPEMADSLTQQVIANVKDTQPLSRAQAASSAVGNALRLRPLDAIQNVSEAVLGPKIPAATKELIQSAKAPVNRISDYSSKFQTVQDKINQESLASFGQPKGMGVQQFLAENPNITLQEIAKLPKEQAMQIFQYLKMNR